MTQAELPVTETPVTSKTRKKAGVTDKEGDSGVELLTDDALVFNLKAYRNRTKAEPRNEFYTEVLDALRKEFKKRHGRSSEL